MDFQKKDLIEFLNISLQVEPGNKCGEQSRAVNKLPRFYDGLNVKASVGMGVATAIPWISFTGYNQKTSNGIYPVLLFYHERKVLIVAFGLSVTNKPTVSWNIPNLKTINQYFVERKIVQTKIEQKYNDSFVHSVFPVNVVNNKIDESRFNIDEVFNSLNSVCDTYKKRLENMNKNNGNVENTPNDLINFKHLLEYFCAHLQYVVTGNKSITGYEEYLKQYVDTNTFKKSGQGYKGDKIQLQIKPWEKYNYGNICIAVYGSSPQGYVTYLHWKGTGHNISANWSGNMISSLQLVEFMDYNGNKRWNPQPTKYTIDELGLFDKNEPNANVKEMFNAFVEKKYYNGY